MTSSALRDDLVPLKGQFAWIKGPQIDANHFIKMMRHGMIRSSAVTSQA